MTMIRRMRVGARAIKKQLMNRRGQKGWVSIYEQNEPQNQNSSKETQEEPVRNWRAALKGANRLLRKKGETWSVFSV